MRGPNLTPGHLIEEILEQRGWSRRTLSLVLGIHETTLCRIISGKRALNAKLAIALGDVFLRDPMDFLKLQIQLDIALAKTINKRDLDVMHRARQVDTIWLDPFSRNSPFFGHCITNDLNPSFAADFHLEALDFLRAQKPNAAGVLFDPPYSNRQISECYAGVGRAVHAIDTSSAFYGERKDAAASLIAKGGKAICFGWNSNGFGISRGFEVIEILIVAHGGAHNDTICTVETKVKP